MTDGNFLFHFFLPMETHCIIGRGSVYRNASSFVGLLSRSYSVSDSYKKYCYGMADPNVKVKISL